MSEKKPKPQKSKSLSGRPGSIGWLMQHELRLFWRRGKMNPRSGLILVALLLSIWAIASYFVFMRLGPVIPPPPFDEGPMNGLALVAIGVVIAFIASVMTSGAILAAVEAIYTRNDLDLLLSTPISPWRILIVRASAIAVGAMPIYAGLLGPPLLWMAIFSSPLWLSAIIFIVATAFVATGLALLVVTALFRLIGPRNTRVLAQILSAAAGAAVFLIFQYVNVSSRGDGPMSPEEAQAMIAAFNIDPQVWWLFPSRAFTGDIVSILLWVLVAGAVFPFGVYVFSRRFVADAAAAAAMGKRKRTSDARVASVRGGVMRSIIRKEFRLLLRDPLLLSQIGLQLVYLLPLGFILVRPDSGIPIVAATFAPALALLSSALSGSLVWITVSAEDAPDLITSAPVQAQMVDRAKLFAAITPVLAVMSIPLAAMLVRDPWAGVWATGGVISASTSAALIGLWRRTPGSRREFVRRRQKGSVLTGLGQSLVAIGIAVAAGLGAYGWPWMALIPAIIIAAILGALYKPNNPLAEA